MISVYNRHKQAQLTVLFSVIKHANSFLIVKMDILFIILSNVYLLLQIARKV